MRQRLIIVVIAGLCAIMPVLGARADAQTIQARDIVKQGTIEAGAVVGFLQGLDVGTSEPNRSATYVLPRIGKVVTGDLGKDLYVGNFEVLFEPLYAHYWEPFHGEAAGGSALFKYNFLAFGRWMPFWDLGLGMLWTDLAPRIPEQSEQFNFVLESGTGTQYFMTESIALTIGARFHHISNAGIGDRNLGLNSVLGYVGVSFFLPRQ